MNKIALAALLAAASLCRGAAPIQIKVANEFVERVFEVNGGKVRTTALVNKLDHRTYTLHSKEL